MIQFDDHFFQMGWFNHKLDKSFSSFIEFCEKMCLSFCSFELDVGISTFLDFAIINSLCLVLVFRESNIRIKG